MTGRQLRDELAQIAEGAPRVDIPPDLYARGRRATLRARALAAGGALACLALLFAVVLPAVQADRTDVAAKRVPVMPNHIYAVPEHVNDRESDLQIGTAAAAFVTETGIPVVVSAVTNEYHLLDLDGLLGGRRLDPPVSLTSSALALSPDGRQLAWAWLEPGGDDPDQARAGVRIADLETGTVRDVEVNRVLVSQVSWSPDSRTLAWGGTRITQWTESTFNTEEHLAGTVGPRDARTAGIQVPEPLIKTNGTDFAGDVPFVVAVSDDGALSAISGNLWWQPTEQIRITLRGDQRISSLWPQGDNWFVLIHSTRGDEVAMVRELPAGQDRAAFTLAAQPRMLGVLKDGKLLVHQESLDGDGPPPKVERVVPDAQEGQIDAEKIIDVDEGVLGLTLASDLIDPETPTFAQPEPDWPWSTERKLVTGGLVLLGTLTLGGIAVVAARSRRAG